MKSVEPAKAYRLFYPSVPAIVSCEDAGKVYAMPAVSIISLSNEPPLVGVSSSPAHATHGAILRSGSFSVCWLDITKVRAVEILGTTSATTQDKLESAGLRHSRGRVVGAPVIEDSSAVLECSLSEKLRFGDHELLVGEVKDARAINDFAGYWKFEDYTPILYAGSPDGFRTYHPTRRPLKFRRRGGGVRRP